MDGEPFRFLVGNLIVGPRFSVRRRDAIVCELRFRKRQHKFIGAIGFICGHWVFSYTLACMLAKWTSSRCRTSLITLLVLTAVVGLGIRLIQISDMPISVPLFLSISVFATLCNLEPKPRFGVPAMNIAWRSAAGFSIMVLGLVWVTNLK